MPETAFKRLRSIIFMTARFWKTVFECLSAGMIHLFAVNVPVVNLLSPLSYML